MTQRVIEGLPQQNTLWEFKDNIWINPSQIQVVECTDSICKIYVHGRSHCIIPRDNFNKYLIESGYFFPNGHPNTQNKPHCRLP
jgi:hypothetical protein